VRWLLHSVACGFFFKEIIVTSVKSLGLSPPSQMCQADFQCTLYLRLVGQGHAWVALPNLFLRVEQKCLKPTQVVVVSLLLCLFYFEFVKFRCIKEFREAIF
jgi:hypothetical protein